MLLESGTVGWLGMGPPGTGREALVLLSWSRAAYWARGLLGSLAWSNVDKSIGHTSLQAQRSHMKLSLIGIRWSVCGEGVKRRGQGWMMLGWEGWACGGRETPNTWSQRVIYPFPSALVSSSFSTNNEGRCMYGVSKVSAVASRPPNSTAEPRAHQ